MVTYSLSKIFIYLSTQTLQICKLCFAFRRTTNGLHLVDGSTAKSPEPGAYYVKLYNTTLEKLQDFKNAKRLAVKVFTTENIFKLGSFLQKLRMILFVSYFLQCRTTSSTLDADGDEKEGVIQDSTAVVPKSSVKRFYGDRIILTDESARYLMQKFPQLEYLSLNKIGDSNTTRRQYPIKLNTMLMVQFFEYLLKINCFDIQFIFHGDNVIDVVSRIVRFVAASNKKKFQACYCLLSRPTNRKLSLYPY
jgi:hypothetical protein